MKLTIFIGGLIILSSFIGFQNVNTAIYPATTTFQDEDIAEGTYYIKCRAGSPNNKYLDVSWSCKDEPNCKVQLWSLGNSTSNNKWVVKKEGLPLIGGYTIKSVVNDKYLTGIGDDNGDPPDVEARMNIMQAWRTNQEWKIKKSKTAGGAMIFNIYNKATGKYLDAVNSCVSENGCKVQVWSYKEGDFSQDWWFVKVN